MIYVKLVYGSQANIEEKINKKLIDIRENAFEDNYDIEIKDIKFNYEEGYFTALIIYDAT